VGAKISGKKNQIPENFPRFAAWVFVASSLKVLQSGYIPLCGSTFARHLFPANQQLE